MDFREIKEGEIVMLVPDGSLVAPQDCAALERKMASVFEGKAHSIVLDCQKVGNVSGAALRILLLANRKLLHTGGRLVLCSLSAKVREAFSISGFDRDFVIAVNRTEAMEKAAEETIPLLTPVEDEAAASAPKGEADDPRLTAHAQEALRVLALCAPVLRPIGPTAQPPDEVFWAQLIQVLRSAAQRSAPAAD